MRAQTAKVQRTRDEAKESTWMDRLRVHNRRTIPQKMEDWQDKPAQVELAGEETGLKIYWSRWNQIKKREIV